MNPLRSLWDAVDRLSDWVGPHLAARSTELTIIATATVAFLVIVHIALLLIMRVQRPWERLQRAIFWFLASKTAFWVYLLYLEVRTIQRYGWIGTYPFRFLVMLLLMMATSAWLMFEVDRRYRRNIKE